MLLAKKGSTLVVIVQATSSTHTLLVIDMDSPISKKMSAVMARTIQLTENQRCVEMQWAMPGNTSLVLRYKYGDGIDFRVFCDAPANGDTVSLQDTFLPAVMLVVDRAGDADEIQRHIVPQLISPVSRLVSFMHSQQKQKNNKHSYSYYQSKPLPPIYCEWENSTDVVLYSSLDAMGYIGRTQAQRMGELVDALTLETDESGQSMVIGPPIRVVQLKEVDTERVIYAPVSSGHIEQFVRPASLTGNFTWSINGHSKVYNMD
jgi:hypothetical protein